MFLNISHPFLDLPTRTSCIKPLQKFLIKRKILQNRSLTLKADEERDLKTSPKKYVQFIGPESKWAI